MKSFDLKRNLKLEQGNLDDLLGKVNLVRLKNNPVYMDMESIKEIYSQILISIDD